MFLGTAQTDRQSAARWVKSAAFKSLSRYYDVMRRLVCAASREIKYASESEAAYCDAIAFVIWFKKTSGGRRPEGISTAIL